MLDATTPLAVLRDTWEACTACDLGERRRALQGDFVFGQGAPRGLMFIGDGPNKTDEALGEPFTGAAGDLLRKVLHKFGILDVSYLTNLVACRSCTPVTDEHGNVRLDRKHLPLLGDQSPTQLQITACRQRLLEQIYAVDPVLIVTLGLPAAEALLGHPVALSKDRGTTEPARFPGVLEVPSFTEKKGVWARKVHGQLTLPLVAFEVEYLVMPTWHPFYILRRGRDDSPDSPLKVFVEDIRNAVRIYQQYMSESFNIRPNGLVETEVTTDDLGDFDLWPNVSRKRTRSRSTRSFST